MITRHFVDVGGRRVHYRRAGAGPPVLMVHQSPRSSAEYQGLIADWSRHFTCIAPDTPGFGESEPLPGAPEIDDFADALLALLDALGLRTVAAYGFHSGGVILMAALRRVPQRFTALAIGGYAVWTPDEVAAFGGDRYLPPLQPSPYGEHLTWLWRRVLEQSWFFPWFDVRDAARLSVAHADPVRVNATVMDMLAAGDAYRAGYGAVLRAPRGIPAADAAMPPVLITAYDGDPLQPHLDRLGDLPAGWRAHRVATPAAHQAASRDLLGAHPAPPAPKSRNVTDAGFVAVETAAFTGLLHWRGNRAADALTVAGPGRAAALLDAAPLALDPPGHGLSDDWSGDPPGDWDPWRAAIEAARARLGIVQVAHEPLPAGDPERLYPPLRPDPFGHHLDAAWQIVRNAAIFAPWYDCMPGHARPLDARRLDPSTLSAAHRNLVRAGPAARALAFARTSAGV